MSKNSVIEVVTFTINAGVSVDQFATLNKAVENEHVARQPGFISRESAAGENATWLVIVHWADTASADASMASFATAPSTAAFMAAIKPNTMVMTRYTTLRG